MRRDDPDVFELQQSGPPTLEHPAELVIEALRPLVTARRFERIQTVVAGRTHRVTVVLEDIADPHNTSAVLRSCDAFGVQRVHVVPGPHGFLAARAVTKGAHQWLDVLRHRRGPACVAALQREGFTVLYASMEGERRPQELATLPKVAVVFGNEHRGPSPEVRAACDGGYAIPMRGFVDSLNVSVAAAITLFAATGEGSDLTETERRVLTARYLMQSVRDARRIVAEHVASQDRGPTPGC